ncbi:hypothetical protein [Methylobacterium platani]|uniref:Uncharacterized protein n=2 Tax=Methylobacterium platani TaxID=427683 RepID=A0A179S4L1_9HYPH|nr:hypothetical protein [Methylobacterium platani]KMO15132.1 hypothetical protein SQ03_17710 [Methylobacterium platani JCM 14648]OAS20794.1 hypothetical protein A5481_22130 [Methylobacterium platani]
MPLSLKLPRRNPDAPRPTFRERYAALKGSAAKVIGKPARFTPPKPTGAGTPSKALAAALAAHEMAYGYALYTEAYGLPDVAERRQAEEEAFRALLHMPLHSDTDRAAYAAAVISRQMHSLGDASATERDHPMAVAFRNLSFGEHAREPEEMRHVGRPVEPKTAADPILAAIEEHQAAFAAWAPLLDIWNDAIMGTPEYDAAEVAAEGPRERERAAFNALLSTRPTTAVGLRALAAYLPEAMRQSSPDTDAEALAVLDAFRDAALSVPQTDDGRSKSAKATPARVDTYDHETGLVTYADAAGAISTRPAAEWIAFMAMRLHHIARSERTRRFNAECKGLDGAACAELEARLTRDLRIDALHALMFRSDQIFAEAQSERNGHTGAGTSAEKVDLKPLTVLQLVNLHEAYQAARHLWEGVVARPYSVAFRDPRGCVHASPVGHLADFEETRAALVGERIISEITNRSPQNERERDYILSLRIRHEIDCEDRIRDADMMREISQAWGA